MCKQPRWRHLCTQGMEWRERGPDEEPGESILWGVSFGFGKRCTYGQEGEGSCDVCGIGGWGIHGAREGATCKDISC